MTNSESGDYGLLDQLAEEFADRYRRGERPPVKEYLDRYPELADDLRRLLPAMVEIEQVKEDALPSEPVAPPLPLTHLGDYRILREIGRGGMGVVFEAEQVSLGRRVALKLLPAQKLRDATQKRRFEREARAAAKLHHTNIVPVFGVGEHDGQPYYVMQLIQGLGMDAVLDELRKLPSSSTTEPTRLAADPAAPRQDLSANEMARSLLTGAFSWSPPDAGAGGDAPPTIAATIDSRAAAVAALPSNPSSATSGHSSSSFVLPGQNAAEARSRGGKATYWRSVARIGVQVASALEYAHKQDILHRDVKPSNLLLDLHGTVWVTDFGLAKVDDHQNLTQTGDILGTFRYMPPEAFDGRSDARSDVYALGLTLYEMLALRPAFDERERNRLLKQVTMAEPAPLRRLNPAIPRDLATIIHKAAERDPARRYQTAAELEADLQRFLDDEPIRARRVSSVERLARWCGRNRAVASLASSVLLLLTTLAVVSTLGALWLGKALHESQTNLGAAQKANAEANARLWDSLLTQARASRMTHQSGQRLNALRAIRKALELPLPPGRSVDELRTEAIAALCLPDLEVVREWDGAPVGTGALAFDADFKRYTRSDPDGNVTIRRVADDTVLATLPGIGGVDGYGGLEFSPDGRFLYQVCEIEPPRRRWRGRLWKLDGAEPILLSLSGGDHSRGTFEPSGRRCALAYPNQTVRVFDLDTGREVKQFRHRVPGEIYLTWNPRQPLLAVWGWPSRTCALLDVDTGAVRRELQLPSTIDWLDWHPDGEVLALPCHDHKIYFLDARSGQQVLAPLEGHKTSGIVCRFNHSGDWLVSNDWGGLLRVWDTRTGQQLLAQGGSTFPQFSRDDTLVGPLILGSKVQLLRCSPGKGLRSLPAGAGGGFHHIHGRACTDEKGRWLAVKTINGLSLIDLLGCREAAGLPLVGNGPFRFDRADHSLWTYGQDGLLRWPIRSDPADTDALRVGPPQILASIRQNNLWDASRDGEVVAIPIGRGAAVVWHRSSNRRLDLGEQEDVRSCAVSPDGKWVATGSHGLSRGGGAKVWDAASGRHGKDLPVAGLCGVNFSPDGKWLATTGGGCRLWEVGTWREGPKLDNPSSNAFHAFTADDGIIALGDQLGVVRLVVPDTGREIARLTVAEPTRLAPVCFTPDGAQLAAIGAESQALYLFDLRIIRKELQELNLDWDAPPLPPAPPDPPKPLRMTVELGNFRQTAQAGRLVSEASRLTQAKKHAEALARLREAVKTDPKHAVAHNNLAWLLVTGPKELRNPKEAVPLARKAVELGGKALSLNTLGVALYRNGEFQEAVTCLEKSLAASKGESDAFDLFFLAMCHHQRGDAARAKDHYDRAMKWLQEQRGKLNPTWLVELTAFQAEAEALLKEPVRPAAK
jgi:serine/threonine protein kinase/WD40 repeat protein/Tfp pilus assembly protein PilF